MRIMIMMRVMTYLIGCEGEGERFAQSFLDELEKRDYVTH